MNTFLPQFQGRSEEFLMASHVERLHKSQCFKSSEKLTCITCHDPHISVKEIPIKKFNNSCQSCHTDKGEGCSAPKSKRMAQDNNCSGCHMPKSGSIDIPHVGITDHNIQIPKKDDATTEQIEKFVQLQCLTTEQPSDKSKAKGFLAYYEKFAAHNFALDSAEYLLIDKPDQFLSDYFNPIIHLYYLKNDYNKVLQYAQKVSMDSITEGWTAYRIGEAYFQGGNYSEALQYFQKAVRLKPYNLDFRNKLGSTQMQLNQIQQAEQTFEFITSEQPKYVSALSNLGYVYLRQQKPNLSNVLYQDALSLNPDYVPALLNKAGLKIYRQKYEEARPILKRVLEINPHHTRAQQLLQRLSAME
jgi:tetratricopeptide (TPR) repeat protein